MKSNRKVGLLTAVVVIGAAATGMAQNVLGRLESDIRQANGQPPAAATPAARAYLGAIALDEAGHGVRITAIGDGGPAQRAGLHARDLVVGAAGKRVQSLRELTAVLGGMNPGDRLALDVVRGARQMHIEVTLGTAAAAPHAAGQPVPPPLPGPAGGRTEPIPPPPTELAPPSPGEGPALIVPQGIPKPVSPSAAQAADRGAPPSRGPIGAASAGIGACVGRKEEVGWDQIA